MNSGQKTAIVTACLVVSAGAIAGGLWLRAGSAPLAMPATADEAFDGLRSDRYAEMDDQRRRQYAAEAMRLMRDLPEDERRGLMDELREDEDLREAMRQARQDAFDEMVRRAARGEGMEAPQWGRPGGGGRPDPDEMTPEERERMEQMRERMAERIAQQMKDAWDSGDAQSSGLRQEFFKNRTSERGGRRGR